MCANFNDRNRWLHSILQRVEFLLSTQPMRLMSVDSPTANNPKGLETTTFLATVPNSPSTNSVSACDIQGSSILGSEL